MAGPGRLFAKAPNRFVLLRLAFAAVFAMVPFACGGTDDASESVAEGAPQPGGTLNLLGSGDVDHMDPNVSYYSIGYLAHRAWTRQPYSYPADPALSTTAVPDLAQELPEFSADGLSASWSIRAGVEWNSDPPRQVTAEDVIRGIKITCNPVLPFGGLPSYADLFEGFGEFCDGFAGVRPDPAAIAQYIEDHDVPGLSVGDDELAVEMSLTRPAPYLAELLTLPAFSARPTEYDAFLPGSAELAQNTISAGPYQIASYEPTRSIQFERNATWSAANDPIRAAHVDRIVIDETVSQESTQQRLETGEASADMGFDNFPPIAALPELISAQDPRLSLGATASTYHVVFNLRSPNNHGALEQVEVRRAVSQAINRTNIIQALGGSVVNPPLTHVLPASIGGSSPDFDLYPHDPAAAEDQLAAAGHGDGLTLTLLYAAEAEAQAKTFEVVQHDLAQLNIDVEGLGVPNADVFTKYLYQPDVATRGVWDLALVGWAADWYGNAALSFFRPLYSGPDSFPPNGSNFGYYDSNTTNSLIEQATEAADITTAAELWHEADEQVMGDAAIYPIAQPTQPNFHSDGVHNAVYIPMLQNFDPTNVWLDADARGG